MRSVDLMGLVALAVAFAGVLGEEQNLNRTASSSQGGFSVNLDLGLLGGANVSASFRAPGNSDQDAPTDLRRSTVAPPTSSSVAPSESTVAPVTDVPVTVAAATTTTTVPPVTTTTETTTTSTTTTSSTTSSSTTTTASTTTTTISTTTATPVTTVATIVTGGPPVPLDSVPVVIEVKPAPAPVVVQTSAPSSDQSVGSATISTVIAPQTTTTGSTTSPPPPIVTVQASPNVIVQSPPAIVVPAPPTITVLSSPTVQTVFAEPPVRPAQPVAKVDLLPTEFLQGSPPAPAPKLSVSGTVTVTSLSSSDIQTVQAGKSAGPVPSQDPSATFSANMKVQTVVVEPPKIPAGALPLVKEDAPTILRVVNPPLTMDDLSAPLFPPAQPNPVRVLGDLTTAWIAARSTFLEAIKRPFVFISNLWKLDSTLVNLDDPEDARAPHSLEVMNGVFKRSARSVNEEPDHSEPHVLKESTDQSGYELKEVQKIQDGGLHQPQTLLDECGALLTGMSTSVCGRFEAYTITSCSNDTNICSNLAQQDLVRLMGICSKPVENLMCKMSNKVEPSPKCKYTTCNVYKFSIVRVLDQTSRSCSSQMENLSKKLLD